MITYSVSIPHIKDFKAWGGGEDTIKYFENLDRLDGLNDVIENYIEMRESYGETMSEVEINDMLRFDMEFLINEILGFDPIEVQ